MSSSSQNEEEAEAAEMKMMDQDQGSTTTTTTMDLPPLSSSSATTTATPSSLSSAGGGVLQVTDFHCAICMDLLYKPCINSICGHAFCFWCFHFAMDVFKEKHYCPLCRAEYGHLPAVCIPLHQYITYAFPKEAALREKEITTTTWGMASFNLGIGYRLDGKYDEAIKVFIDVLKSDVNDRDPGANIMEHFRNYRHKACYEISYNYEAKGEIEKALEYMELAKTKYEFQDVCGTCFEQAEERRLKRIEMLTEKKNLPNKSE